MPRFIEKSRGWVFGRLDGPHLDFLPSRPSEWRRGGPGALAAQLEDLAARMTAHPPLFLPPDRFPSLPLRPGTRSWALATRDGAYVLRLHLPPGVALMDGLYQVEEAEDGLPAFLLAPFAWIAARPPGTPLEPAEAAMRMSTLVFLVHRHEGGRARRVRPMERAALRDALIRRIWRASSEAEGLEAIGALPLGGTDTVRVALEAGEALWTETGLPAEDPTPAGFLLAFRIARAAPSAPGGDWSVWWETVRARRAGRPAPPSDWPPSQAVYTAGLQVLMGDPPPPDADLARGLGLALMARAEAEGHYVPAGRFRVRVPDLPLFRRAGVTALRAAVDPQGIWVQLLGERGPGEVFRLDRTLPLRPDIAADPAWGAVAAALWHDLRAGIPARPGGEARKGRRLEKPPEETPSLPAPSVPRPLVLPRPFRVMETEEGHREPEVEWGEPEGREDLRRTAHWVRGHLRRLAPGWTASTEAREVAEALGVILPEGYTFVRPHLRGGRREGSESPPEREAIPRGLHSLALLG